jgi:hypothetical protein
MRGHPPEVVRTTIAGPRGTQSISGRRTVGERLLVIVLATTIAVFAFGYRFFSLELTNDDYLFFAIGRQIQHFGDWPVRDLAEEGDPLHNVVSAVLQSVFGYSLAGEAFFDLAMLSLAAAVTFLLAAAVSESMAIGIAVTILVVLFAARLYDYPKAVMLAVGLWLCFRYIDRPSRLRAALMGIATGVAFLFRHDFGAYLGLASLAVLVAQVVTRSVATAGIGAYAAALAVSVIPFLAYVEIHGGVRAYVAMVSGFIQREVGRDRDPHPAMAFDLSRPLWEQAPGFPVKVRWAGEFDASVRSDIERRYALEDGRQEDGRTWTYTLRDQRPDNLRAIVLDPHIEDTANIDRTVATVIQESAVQRIRRALRRPPAVAIAPGVFTLNNAVAWLYYLFISLPYVAVAALGLARLRGKAVPTVWMKVVTTALVAAAAAPLWLRGNLYRSSRLADLAVPAAVLGAFLLARGFQPRGRRFVTICLVTTALACYFVTAGSIVSFAQVKRGVDDALVAFDGGTRHAEIERRLTELLASPPSLEWVSRETGMRGAVEYLRNCTAPDDRVFVYGFYPQLLFFSGRGSAADRMVILRGFFTRPEEQQRTIDAIGRSHPPVVLIDVNAAGRPDGGRLIDATLPLIDRYLSQRYVSAGVTSFGASTDAEFHVLVDKQRVPTGTYRPFLLPCFVPGL